MTGFENITLANRYFLKRLIGAGGMAQVYYAWDRQKSIDVAIKIPHNADFFKPFLNDAIALKAFNHPNIVRFYDAEVDEQKGVVFFVMEWVSGSDLQSVLRNRRSPLGIGEVCHVFDGIHRALHYIHENKIIHCDVKPANILLRDTDEQVLLSDFGLAQLTHHKGKGGTVTYMAPEQFTGDDVSERTDIYSLGVTLYQLLSGRLPFPGETKEKIINGHLYLPPPPIQIFNPKIPRRVAAVLEKSLSKRPDQRYASITEFWIEFENARSGFVEQPPPPSSSLIGIRGEKSGKTIQVFRQSITIGRSKNNQVRLRHPSISRYHATIIWKQGKYFIWDKGSSVGTYLNGRRVPPYKSVPLRNGDKIRLGVAEIFEFRFR